MAVDPSSDHSAFIDTYFGKRCEVRVLEERIDKKGNIEAVVKGEFKPSDLDPNGEYALVTKRAFDRNNVLTETTLSINSPHLLQVFKKVVGFYPTIATNFDDPFEMKSPFSMLYHHWDDLKAFKATNVDDTTRMHLSLLLEYIEHELGPAKIRAENMIRRGFITYSDLWTIYKPGAIQYIVNYGHPRLVKLKKAYYDESKVIGPYLEVQYVYVDYNGREFGQANDSLQIREKGNFGMGCAAKITSLEIYPRRFVNQSDSLETRLLLRGQHFLKFATVEVMRYSGKHEYLKEPPGSWYDPAFWRSSRGIWLPSEESGRVVIDRKTFAEDYEEEQTSLVPVIDTNDESPNTRYEVLDSIGKLDPILCPSFVYGFSLQKKVWCRFYIDNLTAIEWNPNAMEDLLLPDRQKNVMKALVSSHVFPSDTREEAQLKGKGLVILLHGSPGSGKTMTAERAAEMTHKGLLTISMGELTSDGTDSYFFELKIKQFLRLATTWQAVALIDEADIFLEHRQNGETEKNTLVAVFLRHLEYFSGILFLTSNRVDVFDPAIKSRLHLALQYKPPTLNTRLQLWTQRLAALPTDSVDLDVDETISVVGKAAMNGREISNTVNTALTLARHQGGKLRLDHFETVIQVWHDFNRSLEVMEEEYKTTPRRDSMVATGWMNSPTGTNHWKR